MTTTIDTSGLKRAVATRAGFIAQRASIDIRKELIQAAKPHYQTGEMERAMKVTHQRLSPTLWRVTAENPTVQAATTSHGARPHEIRPAKAQVLRFVMDGRVVYAKVVHHPGNKASRWFERIFNPVAIRGILSRFVGR